MVDILVRSLCVSSTSCESCRISSVSQIHNLPAEQVEQAFTVAASQATKPAAVQTMQRFSLLA